MIRESEPFRLPKRDFEQLDSIAGRIRPDDDALLGWFEGYWRRHRSRLAADLRILRAHVAPGARVLECGAVPLLTTAALDALGYRVSALDLAPARFATAIASLGLDVRQCDLETEPAPFEAESFDAVVFNELFEHLRINPIETLSEVRRVLAPDGVLVLSTPNLRSFRGLRNLLVHNQAHAASGGVYEQYEKLASLGHMGHVREYTSREVCEFLERLRFRVERIIFRGGHGRGLVGLAERCAPALRPFFSVIATRSGAP